MLMTLVLPGSAQVVAGNKRMGRAAMRVVFGLLATAALLFLLSLLFGSFVFWLFSNTLVLALVRFGLIALAIGWAGLFIDAWRLGDPLALRQKQRLAMVGLNGVMCFSVVGSLLFASHIVAVQRDFISTMFGAGTATEAHDGRYNVLLLGGDSGADRWGLRPDSINVASIDEETGETVIFGLPRNMTNFSFPKGSIMREQFPDGYDCGAECELNSLMTWAQDHKGLFKGVEDPGVEATTQAVEGITGLKVNYWAMVNLRGFERFVNAVGGVRINVRDRIPIGGVGAPVTGYIEPGRNKLLNGHQTLWFARSRESADDYSRMARQKCVMGAMLNQLEPKTVVLRFGEIAQASKKLLSTDLPASELDNFAQLALKAKAQPIRTVSFVPPMIHTSDPDIDKIHAMVEKALDPEKAKKAKPAKKSAGAGGSDSTAKSGTTGGSIGNLKEGYAANQASDLAGAC